MMMMMMMKMMKSEVFHLVRGTKQYSYVVHVILECSKMDTVAVELTNCGREYLRQQEAQGLDLVEPVIHIEAS